MSEADRALQQRVSHLEAMIEAIQKTLGTIAEDVASTRRAVLGAPEEGNDGVVQAVGSVTRRVSQLERIVDRAKWSSIGWAAGGGGLLFAVQRITGAL